MLEIFYSCTVHYGNYVPLRYGYWVTELNFYFNFDEFKFKFLQAHMASAYHIEQLRKDLVDFWFPWQNTALWTIHVSDPFIKSSVQE